MGVRNRRKITKRVVDAAAPLASEYTIWDTDIRGFGLRVQLSGKKSYVVYYRAGYGRGAPQRRYTIGPPSETLTAAQAREAAGAVLAEARLGHDPAGERARRRREPTIAEICDRYLEEHVAAHNRPRTEGEARRLVTNRIKPALGKIKVSDLTRARVKDWHHALAHPKRPARQVSKTGDRDGNGKAKPAPAGAGVDQANVLRRRKFTPYEANRALAVLSKLMSLAAGEWEIRADNPCIGVKRFPERKRDRFYSPAELKAIAQALDGAECDATERSGTIAAIRLLALTGCRVGEIRSLRWEHVDLEHAVLRLPDTKTGARAITIGAPAAQLLADLIHDGAHVVHGGDPEEPLSLALLTNGWRRIRAAAGLHDARLHDFRHTVGTVAGQSGMNAFLVRDLLGHRTLATTARYVEHDNDPARAAADHVAGRIAASMEGNEAVVVRFPRG